jgi:Uma2 family endonuclease
VVENKGCELIDGTLVEKAMGLHESFLASALIDRLRDHVIPRNLGMVSGEHGTLEILTDLVRIPDVAYISWDRFPDRRIPDEPVPAIVPDLTIEVLSRRNTTADLNRKRQEYFTAGVRLVWIVDRFNRTVSVYSDADQATTLTEADSLTGDPVLPGFAVPIRELFAELDRHG